MVSDITQRLVEPFAYFPKFETLKIEQVERCALHLSETLKCR